MASVKHKNRTHKEATKQKRKYVITTPKPWQIYVYLISASKFTSCLMSLEIVSKTILDYI